MIELIIVMLYEHGSHSEQIILASVAALTGLVAALAFMCPMSDVETSIGAAAAQSDQPTLILAHGPPDETLPTFDLIRIPHIYRDQWSQLLYEAKPARLLNDHLKAYSKLVELGHTRDWISPELTEVFKAVTASNRQFTIELTNSDSILIHCDPVMPETTSASEEGDILPELAAAVALMHLD